VAVPPIVSAKIEGTSLPTWMPESPNASPTVITLSQRKAAQLTHAARRRVPGSGLGGVCDDDLGDEHGQG
jgi:hypothetical protein